MEPLQLLDFTALAPAPAAAAAPRTSTLSATSGFGPAGFQLNLADDSPIGALFGMGNDTAAAPAGPTPRATPQPSPVPQLGHAKPFAPPLFSGLLAEGLSAPTSARPSLANSAMPSQLTGTTAVASLPPSLPVSQQPPVAGMSAPPTPAPGHGTAVPATGAPLYAQPQMQQQAPPMHMHGMQAPMGGLGGGYATLSTGTLDRSTVGGADMDWGRRALDDASQIAQLDAEAAALDEEIQQLRDGINDARQQHRGIDAAMLETQRQWQCVFQEQQTLLTTAPPDFTQEIVEAESALEQARLRHEDGKARYAAVDAQLAEVRQVEAHKQAQLREIDQLAAAFKALADRRGDLGARCDRLVEVDALRAREAGKNLALVDYAERVALQETQQLEREVAAMEAQLQRPRRRSAAPAVVPQQMQPQVVQAQQEQPFVQIVPQAVGSRVPSQAPVHAGSAVPVQASLPPSRAVSLQPSGQAMPQPSLPRAPVQLGRAPSVTAPMPALAPGTVVEVLPDLPVVAMHPAAPEAPPQRLAPSAPRQASVAPRSRQPSTAPLPLAPLQPQSAVPSRAASVRSRRSVPPGQDLEPAPRVQIISPSMAGAGIPLQPHNAVSRPASRAGSEAPADFLGAESIALPSTAHYIGQSIMKRPASAATSNANSNAGPPPPLQPQEEVFMGEDGVSQVLTTTSMLAGDPSMLLPLDGDVLDERSAVLATGAAPAHVSVAASVLPASSSFAFDDDLLGEKSVALPSVAAAPYGMKFARMEPGY